MYNLKCTIYGYQQKKRFTFIKKNKTKYFLNSSPKTIFAKVKFYCNYKNEPSIKSIMFLKSKADIAYSQQLK